MSVLLLRQLFFSACVLIFTFSLIHSWHFPRHVVFGLAERMYQGMDSDYFPHIYADNASRA